ncbi:MAG: hypothetical protein CVU56_29910 [Deltaproteobacteria bacterium HGW-Deltaproteobacteria-14]|nr:MAG: hypothetical protein CVU56_29910 [Deltaproteobacteria bacterium HGW-Deltaproteobacteria-14]
MLVKLIAKLLGIVVIGGALTASACDKGTAPAPEGASAVAVEGAAVTDNAAEVAAAPGEVAVAAGEVAAGGEAAAAHVGCDHGAKGEAGCAGEAGCDHAAKAGAGEADCPFHEGKGEVGCDCPFHEGKGEVGCDHAAKAGAGEADCPFHEEKGEGGCGHHLAAAPAAGEAVAAATAGEAHFGDAFTLTEAKPLAAVVAGSADGADAVVQVSGTIHEVCQKKGCWMVVRDGEAEARVVMKGYAFTVPKDAKGKPTVIEGTLKVRTFTEAQAKHLAEDAGKDPATVTGEAKEYVVTASAITIKG